MPIIHDLAVIAKSKKNPSGEAAGHAQSSDSMSVAERQDMQSRLLHDIEYYMQFAHDEHLNKNLPPANNYITRLSTHEFFFYTREPLTLQEFEQLQNYIALKAQTLSAGVQLVLGSFAVKNEQNDVMNITPHINCGEPPTFNFLVKNTLSDIDVRYKEIINGERELLWVVLNTKDTPPLPTIKINDRVHSLTFNNVIQGQTPGGENYLTAIDICCDHSAGVARTNIDALRNANPEVVHQPISHMLIANSHKLQLQNCFGDVMHVDPKYSPTESKMDVAQTRGELKFDQLFGKNELILLDVAPTPCQQLSAASSFADKANRLITYFDSTDFDTKYRVKNYLDGVKSLKTREQAQIPIDELHREMLVNELEAVKKALHELEFGDNDEYMQAYSKDISTRYRQAESLQEKEAVINAAKTMIADLKADDASTFIRNALINFRNNQDKPWSIKMGFKATLIEEAMRKMPISERSHFIASDFDKDEILKALAYRRTPLPHQNAVNNPNLDSSNAGTTYKKFKQQFLNNAAALAKRPEEADVLAESSLVTTTTAFKNRLGDLKRPDNYSEQKVADDEVKDEQQQAQSSHL